MSLLSLDRAGCSFERKRILHGISFDVGPGEFLGVAGLNGSGKTTLLKLIQRIYKPDSGTIHLKRLPLSQYSAKDLAKIIGALPQTLRMSFDFTAKQLVLLGRTPYLGILSNPSAGDLLIAEQAMRQTDCLQFSDCSVLKLSAGEFQRILMAAALAQQPEILLMDEPTNALDMRQQSRLMNLFQDLKRRGIALVCASHDLSLLIRHSDRVLLLDGGQQIDYGPPREVLNMQVLREHFEMRDACQ
jgi:iron complex transport system ATP-binding protein